jgi:AcrR family transcriptional regulator
MVVERRETARSAMKRALLLDATAQIMLDEGYAAVSSRSVAAKAGMKAPLVHYDFPTLDDLFLALLRRGASWKLERLAAALASPQPLLALWETSIDPTGTAIVLEMVAAANHRPAVKAELIQIANQFYRMQIQAFAQLLPTYGVDLEVFPPELVVRAMEGLAQLQVSDQTLQVEGKSDLERLPYRKEITKGSDGNPGNWVVTASILRAPRPGPARSPPPSTASPTPHHLQAHSRRRATKRRPPANSAVMSPVLRDSETHRRRPCPRCRTGTVHNPAAPDQEIQQLNEVNYSRNPSANSSLGV